MNCKIEYTTSYSSIELVHDNLYLYNTKQTGRQFDTSVKAKKEAHAGALILRGAEDNNFFGGLVWHWIDSRQVFVDYMFLSEQLRGQNWGRKTGKSRRRRNYRSIDQQFSSSEFLLENRVRNNQTSTNTAPSCAG